MTILLAATLLAAQPIQWPASFDALAKKAKEANEVTLDRSTLKSALGFLGDAAQALKGLEEVYVRSFEFEKPGAYSMADVENVRSQIQAGNWRKVISTHNKEDGERVEVYVRNKTGAPSGWFILSMEPTELTVVQVLGSVNLADLDKLGNLGVPKVDSKVTKYDSPEGKPPAKKE